MSPAGALAADEVRRHNRQAWDQQVAAANRWTVPVSAAEVAAARRGEWRVLLTPVRPVPREWFPPLAGAAVLCLAGGGGQQGPILAAAGARVWVLDASPRQLEQDRLVATREGLPLVALEGDMADLSALADASFDLVFHPVANCFVPDVRPLWREAHRVLRPGGLLLAGFANPVLYLFDDPDDDPQGCLTVRHPIPHSDATALDPEERARRLAAGVPLEFGHTLEDQIGGQLDAGLVLTALYEDSHHRPGYPLDRYLRTFIATRAVKPGAPPG